MAKTAVKQKPRKERVTENLPKHGRRESGRTIAGKRKRS